MKSGVLLVRALRIRERSDCRVIGETEELMEEGDVVLLRDDRRGRTAGQGAATRARAQAVREAVEAAEALAREGLEVQPGGLRQRRAPVLAQLQGETWGMGKQQWQAWLKRSKDSLLRSPVCSSPTWRIPISRMMKRGPFYRRMRVSNTCRPSRLRTVQVISR